MVVSYALRSNETDWRSAQFQVPVAVVIRLRDDDG